MKYYDLPRHWTKRVVPHLQDEELQNILFHEFGRFVRDEKGKEFKRGQVPQDFSSLYWTEGRKGRLPAYSAYACMMACHWLVDFNLRLASLVLPEREWRVLTSDEHSTVWDGDKMLFEFNFLLLGIAPQECFASALFLELPPGMPRRLTLGDDCYKGDLSRMKPGGLRFHANTEAKMAKYFARVGVWTYPTLPGPQ